MSSPKQDRLPFEKPIYEMEEQLAEMEAQYAHRKDVADPQASEQIRILRRQLAELKRLIYTNIEPWDRVKVSRHRNRPQSRDYINLIFDDFVEIHGDRAIGDDRAIVTGFARLEDQKVLFVGHQKGRTLSERTTCNFGCAHPEGYRKALAKMKLAAKFGLPIVSFIDTPGAYPGIAAEERGQAAIIAENLMAMSMLNTPIVCVVIGEGGSGGALGIGIGDRVGMMEHAYYSVISPEGCATILWKTAEKAPLAASALRMIAPDLLRMGIIDGIVEEPLGGAHRDHRQAANSLKSFLVKSFRDIAAQPRESLLELRYQKFRKIGVFEEGVVAAPVIAEDVPTPVVLG